MEGYVIYTVDLLKDIDEIDNFDEVSCFLLISTGSVIPPLANENRKCFSIPVDIATKLENVEEVSGSSIMDYIAAKQLLNVCKVFKIR